MAFGDDVVQRCPVRITPIRPDHGHEVPAQFHWHGDDRGIEHGSSTARTPRLNGTVERPHRTDATEFDQLLTYTDAVDREATLGEWERFSNRTRPHTAPKGTTPSEALRARLATCSERHGEPRDITGGPREPTGTSRYPSGSIPGGDGVSEARGPAAWGGVSDDDRRDAAEGGEIGAGGTRGGAHPPRASELIQNLVALRLILFVADESSPVKIVQLLESGCC